ncbi:MAG: HNH endonuclease [Propionibacteriaceae bacterium]|nr:HNH endonuclease [Propionibacteriaceae bacterium]
MAQRTHDLTAGQWSALVAAWGGCAYCGETCSSYTKDCMLPISRGGRYTLTNVVPACTSCNASKWNTEVTSWMRRKKLDEQSFLVRQFQIVRSMEVVTPPPTAISSPPPATTRLG